MTYDVVIGLEIHAELSTKSKVFCECEQDFGGDVNTRCCPRCIALPGALPILNKEALEYSIKAGLAIDCDINLVNAFDRKNYFYPDLPKAYQISQLYKPICVNGKVKLSTREVRVNRIHLEEDAGKLIHNDYEGISLADYNRCSVPLIEIVTEPDITTAEEAKEFVEIIASRLRYTEVCDAKMEEGSLRCDVNISLKPAGSNVLGTRAEIKNLNSLKSIVRAVEFEIERQTELLNAGKRVIQETRRFNENHGKTVSMRSKEEAHDYRYFPDPDIPVLILEKDDVERIAKTMPEMPEERLLRYVDDYKIPEVNAKIIITSKYFSDFYDEAVKTYNNYNDIANLFVVELFRMMNDFGFDGNFKFSASDFALLVKMLDEDKITKAAQKTILRIMYTQGGKPYEIAEKENLIMENNADELSQAISEVIISCSSAVEEYKAGSQKVFGFLMGQIFAKVGKAASPATIKEMLLKELNK